MKTNFKTLALRVAAVAAFAALFTGCCSYTDIAYFKDAPLTDDGEQPIAAVQISNVSYSILGVIPFETGTPWTEGPYAKRDHWNGSFFHNRATVDNNLASLRFALREVGSNRITNLHTFSDDWWIWSLFIMKRHIVKTSCLVLAPRPVETSAPAAPAALPVPTEGTYAK
jgi:hypothetical protein